METIYGAKERGYYANSINGAIKVLYSNPYKTCIISHDHERQLQLIITGVMNEIKQRNSKVDNIDDQMLPTVYYWKPEDCPKGKQVYAAEVSMGKFGEVAGNIYMFSQPNYSVLTNPNERRPFSQKAIASLAMLGHLMTKEK